MASQVKLLRAVQEREFERLGGAETIHVDVRIVAATKRDLRRAVADGQFREDLFYRLNVLPVVLPPLRDRRDDILRIAAHFVEVLRNEMKRPAQRFSPAAMTYLMRHDYPGNVRELRNLVSRAVALCPGTVIEPSHLGDNIEHLTRDDIVSGNLAWVRG